MADPQHDAEASDRRVLARRPGRVAMRVAVALCFLGLVLVGVGIGGGAAQMYSDHPVLILAGAIVGLCGVAILWLGMRVRRS